MDEPSAQAAPHAPSAQMTSGSRASGPAEKASFAHLAAASSTTDAGQVGHHPAVFICLQMYVSSSCQLVQLCVFAQTPDRC